MSTPGVGAPPVGDLTQEAAKYALVVRLAGGGLALVSLPQVRGLAAAVPVAVALAFCLNAAALARWTWVAGRLGARVGRLYLGLDAALGIVLTQILGAGSPFVLSLAGTVALTGLVASRRTTAVVAAACTAGYLLASWLQIGLRPALDFHSRVTLPVLLVLTAVGALRLRQARAEQQQRAARVAELGHAAAVAEERLRLARELHDSLTKSLHGLSLITQALGRAAERGDLEAARATSAVVARVLDEVSVEARRTIAGLRRSPDELPFADALLAACEGCPDLEVELDVQEVAEPALAVRYELLALLEEALENVRRHAGTTRARVRVHDDGSALSLTVQDDGVGISASCAAGRAAQGHFGVVGMRERAQRAGGSLTIAPVPAGGTAVEVVVPRAAALR